jgi:hypothetical protein
MFWDLVTRSGSDRALVQSATLTLKYDPQRNQRVRGTETPQSPSTCDVFILDARGKSYCAHFEGWWYVERRLLSEPPREWWNPISWFRRRAYWNG